MALGGYIRLGNVYSVRACVRLCVYVAKARVFKNSTVPV